MKTFLENAFRIISATVLFLFVSAATGYFIYGLRLKRHPLFYAAYVLELALCICAYNYVQKSALRLGIKRRFLAELLSYVYVIATLVGGLFLLRLLLPVLG